MSIPLVKPGVEVVSKPIEGAHRTVSRRPFVVRVRKPAVIEWPERFFIHDEPVARDGHRHEYGCRSMRCENPKAPKCQRLLPLQRNRFHEQMARIRQQAIQQARDGFYASEDEQAPYHYISAQRARWGIRD